MLVASGDRAPLEHSLETGEDLCRREQIQQLNKFKYMYCETRESGLFTVSSLVVFPLDWLEKDYCPS